MHNLPVYQILPDLRQALSASRRVILSAPPGSGKTTVVPPALLAEPWLQGKSILMLEPRRIAARLSAGFMAGQQGEEVGGTVGYRVRFENRVSAATRIEVLTEGMFIRKIQDDPELSGVGLVIFDEFHERSLTADLGMALCLDTLSGLREDLRLLVMSATLETDSLEKTLGRVGIIRGEGKRFDVELVHLDPLPAMDSKRPDHIAAVTCRGIRLALEEQQGDVLVFLPGMGEIRRTRELLAPALAGRDVLVLPLHGSLKLADQHQAVLPDPQGRRRVILATTIAESSLTIEGITVVVDSGWKRVPRFDVNSGLTRLETVRISAASAQQRRGRAGRLAPGCCYRLWNRGVDQGLALFDTPEILQADLCSLALELACWGVRGVEQLTWVDPPPAESFSRARDLLKDLGALDQAGNLTPTGRKMAGIPLHPRLAHMLLEAEKIDSSSLACDVAALLSERDIQGPAASTVDIDERLRLLEIYRRHGKAAAEAQGAHGAGCKRVAQVSKQLAGQLRATVSTGPPGKKKKKNVSVGLLLGLAYPDRIGRKDRRKRSSYLLVSGKRASIPTGDRLSGKEWLAIGAMDAGRKEGRVFLAGEITEDEVYTLFESRILTRSVMEWDEQAASVRAVDQTRLGELILSEKPTSDPDPEQVLEVLLDSIRNTGLQLLPWSKKAIRLKARLECIALWQPEYNWPDFTDIALLESLEEWLAPFLGNIRSREGLRRLNLEQVLQSCLTWEQQQRLEKDAPTHLRVPSGSNIPLQYAPQEPPVLAVRLQEMFGLAETPTICRGQVPVLLHLLSPASRPVQVTSDLTGFWNTGYQEVKKELKGRYPKHHWPDDPWQAKPTARAKPRSGK